MLLDFFRKPSQPETDEHFLAVSERQIPLVMMRNHRARRYLLRLRPDGSARLTIPRGGSVREGREFAEKNTGWLARQLARLPAQPTTPKQWFIGTEILFRGGLVKIEAEANGDCGAIRFSNEFVKVPDMGGDLRPWIVKHLWKIAATEFSAKVFEFAAAQRLTVRRVTVRDQRTRWGSCSRRGTISLNWRLIQTPIFVRDYIILHELMHLRQMNHSARFWREVENVCPDYETAEKWIKQQSALLK